MAVSISKWLLPLISSNTLLLRFTCNGIAMVMVMEMVADYCDGDNIGIPALGN